MKRFVTYIYAYERGSRGKNVGFLRTDLRDDICRMEVHIRLGERFDGKGMIFLVADNAQPVGVPAGELLLTQGVGNARLSCPQNLLGKSGYTVQQLLAFVVRMKNGRILVGSFSSEPPEAIVRGDFEVWSPAAAAQPEAVPETLTAAEVQAPEPVPEAKPRITYQRMEIKDIRDLPGSNRNLCSNSFLVHGFFNYHYLILKTVEQAGSVQRFLGVPGIYEPRERRMALLYGFPEFEAAQPDVFAGKDELFGYWMCRLAE